MRVHKTEQDDLCTDWEACRQAAQPFDLWTGECEYNSWTDSKFSPWF